jgi:hypothetical protein
MKEYPSILSSYGNRHMEFDAYVFDKIDGSNLRFEWTRKGGWIKSGTRTRLFDESDEVFGVAIPLFRETLAQDLEKIAKDYSWQHLIVFTEFWGEGSFAGNHDPDSDKQLTLIDVATNKKGIVGPRDFLKTFGHLNTPNFLGISRWTRGFVQRVRAGEIEGITLEGVVGKAGEGHKLVMRKAKTQAWVDMVKAKFSEEEAEKIINS